VAGEVAGKHGGERSPSRSPTSAGNFEGYGPLAAGSPPKNAGAVHGSFGATCTVSAGDVLEVTIDDSHHARYTEVIG
jgi:hypothetical protein